MNNSILNEVINEYIALKICRLYEKYGKNIGLLGNFPSNYAKAFPLLRDFIEDNLHDIIKSLMEDVDIKEIIGSKKFDNFSKATKNILLDIQQPNDVSNKLKSKTTHFKKEKNMTSEKLITKSNLAEENRKLYDFDNDYSSEIK